MEQGANGFLCLQQTLPTFLPVMALRSLPRCAQGFQASWFVPAVQGPHGVRADWCHRFWTASRFIFVWEMRNLFFGRRSDLAQGSEALQFESRPPKMFMFKTRSCSLFKRRVTSVMMEPAGTDGCLLGTLTLCSAPAHFVSKLLLCCSSTAALPALRSASLPLPSWSRDAVFAHLICIRISEELK